MQATGQYHGVQDVPQFVGTATRVPPPHGHIFNISHESMPPPAAAPSAIAANNHGHGGAHGLSLSHSSSHQHQQHHPQQQFTQLLSQQQQQQFHIQLTNPQQSSQSVQAHPGYGSGIGSNTTTTSAIPMTAPINSMPTNNNIPSDTHHHQQHHEQQHNYHHQQQFQTQIRNQDPGGGSTLSVAPNQLNSVGIGGGNDGNTDNDTSVQHLMTNNINDNNNNNNNNNFNDISKMQSTATGREGSEDGDDLQDEELGDRGGAGNRWPRQEAMALLKIRADMDAAFKDSSLKTPLWEEISRKMAELGYQRSAKKCKEKFENVHKYYKRTKDGKAGRQDGKNYRFFSQLEALYGKSNDNNGTNSNNGNNNSSQLPSSAASMHLPSSNIYNGAGHDHAAIGLMASTRAQPAQNYTLERPHNTTNTSAFNFSFDLTSEEDDDDGDEDEDDEYGEPGVRAPEDVPTGGTNSRKRKRAAKWMKKYIHFFEKVMKKVLEKQEEMQQRFLEALERRDKERMEREKSWRMQEMARMSRENDIRAQERALSASRDASIIAFLQKTTGISISLPPQIANMQNPSLNYKPVPSTGPGQVTIAPLSTTTSTHRHEELDANDRDMNDPNSKRWPKMEVLALIKLRTDLDKRFHEPGSKAVLWEEISSGMSALGYSRTAKRCKEKWENINKYFKKAKESNKKRPEDAKTCPYFHHLNALYQQGLLGGGGNKQQSVHNLSRDKAATDPDGENSDHDVNAEQAETSNAGREDSGHGQEDDSDGSEETNDPTPNPIQNEVPNHGGNDESTAGIGAAAMAISGSGPTPSNQGAVMHLFLSPDSRVNNNNMSINESAASTDANGANKQTTPASSNQIPLVMGNMDQ